MGHLFNAGTRAYRSIFAKPFFYKWNRWLLLCSLKALGVNNFKDRLTGEYEFLSQLIRNREKPVLLDVGANIGQWAQQALSLNSTSQIFAFEPNPNAFATLDTIQGIHAFPYACGALDGTSKMYTSKKDACWPLASCSRQNIARHVEDPVEVDIQLISLDHFLIKHDIKHVTLLKIDVEGFEYDVLQGCQKAIEAGVIRTIQFEFNDMNLYTRRFLRDFRELLPQFTFYRLLPKGKIPLRPHYEAYLSEIFAFQNIVAINHKQARNNYVS